VGSIYSLKKIELQFWIKVMDDPDFVRGIAVLVCNCSHARVTVVSLPLLFQSVSAGGNMVIS
jgi:hypothetical protein